MGPALEKKSSDEKRTSKNSRAQDDTFLSTKGRNIPGTNREKGILKAQGIISLHVKAEY